MGCLDSLLLSGTTVSLIAKAVAWPSLRPIVENATLNDSADSEAAGSLTPVLDTVGLGLSHSTSCSNFLNSSSMSSSSIPVYDGTDFEVTKKTSQIQYKAEVTKPSRYMKAWSNKTIHPDILKPWFLQYLQLPQFKACSIINKIPMTFSACFCKSMLSSSSSKQSWSSSTLILFFLIAWAPIWIASETYHQEKMDQKNLSILYLFSRNLQIKASLNHFAYAKILFWSIQHFLSDSILPPLCSKAMYTFLDSLWSALIALHVSGPLSCFQNARKLMLIFLTCTVKLLGIRLNHLFSKKLAAHPRSRCWLHSIILITLKIIQHIWQVSRSKNITFHSAYQWCQAVAEAFPQSKSSAKHHNLNLRCWKQQLEKGTLLHPVNIIYLHNFRWINTDMLIA